MAIVDVVEVEKEGIEVVEEDEEEEVEGHSRLSKTMLEMLRLLEPILPRTSSLTKETRVEKEIADVRTSRRTNTITAGMLMRSNQKRATLPRRTTIDSLALKRWTDKFVRPNKLKAAKTSTVAKRQRRRPRLRTRSEPLLLHDFRNVEKLRT